MSSKLYLVPLALGVALGALASSGLAQEASRHVLGAFVSHHTDDEYDLSVGVTPSGAPLRAKARIETRETIHVPDHYGQVFDITQDEGVAILWYTAEDGSLRNVVLDQPTSRIYRVKKIEATRFKRTERD